MDSCSYGYNSEYQNSTSEIQSAIVFLAVNHLYNWLSADGATYTSTMEQFSMTLQYGDKNMEIHSDFFQFYNAPTSREENLFNCIKDALCKIPEIPTECLYRSGIYESSQTKGVLQVSLAAVRLPYWPHVQQDGAF